MEKVEIFVRGTSDTFDKLKSAVKEWLDEDCKKIEIISCHVNSAASVNIKGKSLVNCTIVISYRLVTK